MFQWLFLMMLFGCILPSKEAKTHFLFATYLFTFHHSLFSSYLDSRLLALINYCGQLASHIIQNKLEVTENVLALDTCFGNPLIFKAQKPGCKIELLTRGSRPEFWRQRPLASCKRSQIHSLICHSTPRLCKVITIICIANNYWNESGANLEQSRKI